MRKIIFLQRSAKEIEHTRPQHVGPALADCPPIGWILKYKKEISLVWQSTGPVLEHMENAQKIILNLKETAISWRTPD